LAFGGWPWKLVAYLAFSSEEKAREFEQNLKTGSGRAFAKKRLLINSVLGNLFP